MSEPKGTYECPLCGFDKPHTHDAATIRWFEEAKHNPAYAVAGQRRHHFQLAQSQHRWRELKIEFDADPRAYTNKYGQINSEESTYLVSWFLSRDDELHTKLAAAERKLAEVERYASTRFAQLTQEREARAKAEAECERLREHARIVSDAAAAGVLTLGHILPLRACLPEFSAQPPAKEDGK